MFVEHPYCRVTELEHLTSQLQVVHDHPAGNWIHLDIGCGKCSQQFSTLDTWQCSHFTFIILIVVSCFDFLLGSQYYLRCYDDLLAKVRVDFDTQCRSLKKSASLFQMLAKVTWAFYLFEFRSHHVKRNAWKIAIRIKQHAMRAHYEKGSKMV